MGRQGGDIDAFVGPDRAIAEIADRQRGRVTTAQLAAVGVSRHAIRRRISRGLLRREHHGVYVVAWDDDTKEGRLVGALLAAGPSSAVSHRAAAEVWSFMEGPSPVEISAPRSHQHIPGVTLHRPRSLENDVVELHGLRVTTVARTLVDLCSSLSASHVARLCHEAQVQRLVTKTELVDVLERSYGRRGINKLRRLVRDSGAPARSELERRFVRLVADAGLPAPRTNEHVAVNGHMIEFDAHWPDLKLAVELDGWQFHRTRERFESDRERDAALVAAGWRVVRLTWRRMNEDRGGVISDLKRLLTKSGPT